MQAGALWPQYQYHFDRFRFRPGPSPPDTFRCRFRFRPGPTGSLLPFPRAAAMGASPSIRRLTDVGLVRSTREHPFSSRAAQSNAASRRARSGCGDYCQSPFHSGDRPSIWTSTGGSVDYVAIDSCRVDVVKTEPSHMYGPCLFFSRLPKVCCLVLSRWFGWIESMLWHSVRHLEHLSFCQCDLKCGVGRATGSSSMTSGSRPPRCSWASPSKTGVVALWPGGYFFP